MKNDLTPKQIIVFKAIKELMQEGNGRPPTFREIGQRIGKAHTTVLKHMYRLMEKDYLDWEYRTARGIMLTEKGQRWQA